MYGYTSKDIYIFLACFSLIVLQSLNKYIFGEAYVTVAVGTTIKYCVRNV